MSDKRKGPFTVYIVRSRGGTYYTGYTNNLEKRIRLHNEGKGARYLRGRGPVKLVWTKIYRKIGNALRAEYAIKSMTRKAKVEMIKAG